MHLRNEEGAYIEEMKSLTRGRWIVNESEWMWGCGCSRVLHLGEHFMLQTNCESDAPDRSRGQRLSAKEEGSM